MLYISVVYNQINISKTRPYKVHDIGYIYPTYCVCGVDSSITRFNIGTLNRTAIFGTRSCHPDIVSINISNLIDSGINIHGRPCDNVVFFRIVRGEVITLNIEDFANMDLVHNCNSRLGFRSHKNERFNRIKLSIVSFRSALKNLDDIDMDINCIRNNIVEVFDTFVGNWGNIPPKILLKFICDYDLVADNIEKLVQYEWFMRLLPKKVCGSTNMSLCFELLFFAKHDIVVSTLISHGGLSYQNLGRMYGVLHATMPGKIKKYYDTRCN